MGNVLMMKITIYLKTKFHSPQVVYKNKFQQGSWHTVQKRVKITVHCVENYMQLKQQECNKQTCRRVCALSW